MTLPVNFPGNLLRVIPDPYTIRPGIRVSVVYPLVEARGLFLTRILPAMDKITREVHGYYQFVWRTKVRLNFIM